jgi:imidazolonepropionase-like amidohydrolase
LSSGPADVFVHDIYALDVTGDWVGPVDVSVLGGVIDRIDPNLVARPDQLRLDGAGLWLLPGVFDCHLHTGLSSWDLAEMLETPLSKRILETAQVLDKTLRAGVTSVRDAGISDAGVRDAVAAGYVPGPRLQVAVAGLSSTGGHSDGFLAGPGHECSVDYSLPDYPGRPPYLVDGPEEMRKAVRLLLRAGADWIKLFATRGVLAGSDGDFDPELSLDDMAMAVHEAARRQRPVMVHALGGPALGWAVQAGARSIEHGVFLTEADAAAMAAQDCFLVPTLVVYHQLAELAQAGGLSEGRAVRAAAVGEHLGEAVAIARAAGVRIALGTDFGHRKDHGRNLAEIPLLHSAGLSVAETLLAATSVGAELCAVGDHLGSLRPGYEFDAIVVDEDPSDLSVFAKPTAVTAVFKAGQPVLAHSRMVGDSSIADRNSHDKIPW